jgi:DHA1 family inner membrane transport protein
LPKGSAGERPDVRKELSGLDASSGGFRVADDGAGGRGDVHAYLHFTGPAPYYRCHPAFITAMLVLMGVGFSIGNYLGGKLADRSVTATLKGFLLLLIVIMVAIPGWRAVRSVRQSAWLSGARQPLR